MFSQHTVEAIVAITAIDKGVTADEKRRLDELLSRHTERESVMPFITYTFAAKNLKRSPSTIKRLVKAGRLRPVIGTGCKAIGISWESYRDFLQGERQTA